MGDAGFSLVELMIALVILTVGVLGLAAVSAFTIQKVTVAELDTERGAALQTVVERLRSLPLDSLVNGGDSVGHFAVTWSVTNNGDHASVEIVTTGPGMDRNLDGAMPTISGAVADTFTYIVTDS